VHFSENQTYIKAINSSICRTQHEHDCFGYSLLGCSMTVLSFCSRIMSKNNFYPPPETVCEILLYKWWVLKRNCCMLSWLFKLTTETIARYTNATQFRVGRANYVLQS